MKEITLPTIDQVFGPEQFLYFARYGAKSAMSDFSILTNGFVSNQVHVGERFTLDSRTGMWLTQSIKDDNNVHIINHQGCKSSISNLNRQCGIRPVLLCNESLQKFDSLEQFVLSNNVYSEIPVDFLYDDVLLQDELDLICQKYLYGEFPQKIIDMVTAEKLEYLYKKNKVQKTGKLYITDTSSLSKSLNEVHLPNNFIEYFSNYSKYIRLVSGYSDYSEQLLSDGSRVIPNYVYWIKVDPVIWIKLAPNNFISEDILLSGLQFNGYTGANNPFVDSELYRFLNTIMLKNLEPSNVPRNKCLTKHNKSQLLYKHL